MPLYDYKCQDCGKVSEMRHGFNEAYSAPCDACGGKLMRVFNPAPIVFKGSGFYVTDSRKGRSADVSKPEAPKSDAAKPDAPKTDAKPAAASDGGGSKPTPKAGESAA
ncbi:MAG TPA: FmdB family zinc ribbon protein [Candidatus Tumulicola sp.]|jgi:putative FmdB family regulatory protein